MGREKDREGRERKGKREGERKENEDAIPSFKIFWLRPCL